MKYLILILCLLCIPVHSDIARKDRKAFGIAMISIGRTGIGSLAALTYQNRERTMIYKDLSFRTSGYIAPDKRTKTMTYHHGWTREHAVLFGLSSAILLGGVLTFSF